MDFSVVPEWFDNNLPIVCNFCCLPDNNLISYTSRKCKFQCLKKQCHQLGVLRQIQCLLVRVQLNLSEKFTIKLKKKQQINHFLCKCL